MLASEATPESEQAVSRGTQAHARPLLADAEAAGVDLDDVREHVRAAAADEDLDAWTFDAFDTLFTLFTLFTHPISYSVADDGTKDFSNGIHRTQAMRDAGVVTTITTITADDELDEPDTEA